MIRPSGTTVVLQCIGRVRVVVYCMMYRVSCAMCVLHWSTGVPSSSTDHRQMYFCQRLCPLSCMDIDTVAVVVPCWSEDVTASVVITENEHDLDEGSIV
jgi:hypothetical protein